MPPFGAACWNWSTVWPLTIKKDFSLPLSTTRFQSSVVQWRQDKPFLHARGPFLWKSGKAVWPSPALCSRTHGSAVPSILGSLFFCDLKNFGGFAGTLSLFSLACREHSTVARKAETSLLPWSSASRGLGKSTLPIPHLPSSFCPWTRHGGSRGSTIVWFPLLHCVRFFFFFCKSFYSFFFPQEKNLKLHLLLKWLMHWWIMNSPWERPKGQSRGGGNSAKLT